MAVDGGCDPAGQLVQRAICNRHAVDLKPLVDAKQMRRGEQASAQAIGLCDGGAKCRRRALAIRSGDRDRSFLQSGAVDREDFEQRGHPREANAFAVFRQVKCQIRSTSSPATENEWCQIFRIKSGRCNFSSKRIDGLELTSMIATAPGFPPTSTNRSTGART